MNPDERESFSKQEEELKREAYLLKHPAMRWKAIMSAINWAETNRPPHLRRNQPRQPHQKFI